MLTRGAVTSVMMFYYPSGAPNCGAVRGNVINHHRASSYYRPLPHGNFIDQSCTRTHVSSSAYVYIAGHHCTRIDVREVANDSIVRNGRVDIDDAMRTN